MADSRAPIDTIVARLRAAGCVFAEDEAALLIGATDDPVELERVIAERVAGRPLEYVLGWAEFCGLRIAVSDGVFVPRRRTELIVREAAALAPASARVLDLCCGSGAVAAALGALLPDAEIVASDVDPDAVACARRNLDGRAAVFSGDLYDALPDELRGSFDVIAVNAPYVPSEEIALMPPEARISEARVALDGGSDGLVLHRRIASEVLDWLAPGGSLLIETSERQSPVTAAIFADAGLESRILSSGEFDATVVIASCPFV